MNSKLSSSPRLPRVVFKRDLADYFDVSTRYLWRNLLTDDLFAEWGYDRAEFTTAKRFPPGVTLCIYRHFRITDLDATLADEIRTIAEDENGHRAPVDD